MEYSLAGLWNVTLSDGTKGEMYLPGTLDENRIGHRDTAGDKVHPDEDPGKLEEIFGHSDVIATRFTRKYTFEGAAYLTKRISFTPPEGKRIFLEAERARVLSLLVNGREVPDFIEPSISTPHIFEVTGLLRGEGNPERKNREKGNQEKGKGEEENGEKVPWDELTLVSDNSYPGLPHDAIVYSSAATDETQTNWNGVLGEIRLRIEEPVFLQAVRVYPKGGALDVEVVISSDRDCEAEVKLDSEALGSPFAAAVPEGADGGTRDSESGIKQRVLLKKGWNSVHFTELPLRKDVKRWDEYEGFLYEMKASLRGYDRDAVAYKEGIACGKDDPVYEEDIACGKNAAAYKEGIACAKDGPVYAQADENIPRKEKRGEFEQEKTVSFGVRDFGDNGTGKLALNGRTIFLRSEANCAVFPETGHPPMTVEEWKEILSRLCSYGVNCVRFHSHCPPEAAFTAADQLGILMQPELSHWNPRDALESEESFSYYQKEWKQIILWLSNHPSFVMLTLGNELQAKEQGHERMRRMLRMARAMDSTRLYAEGSNVHYGFMECEAESDFYTTQCYFGENLRGTFANMQGYINHQYPNAHTDYDAAMQKIRRTYQKPVFSFEVGQFEVLPDFDELSDFQGVTSPDNYRLIQEKAERLGLSGVWKRYVEATGELALIGYREEIEAAMRTRQLSGISLLGLQDFPGQGTALVGMLNSHLRPKPFDFAKPERFQAFFRDQLPLVLLPRYTYEAGETLKAEVRVANYGKKALAGELEYEVRLADCGKRESAGEPRHDGDVTGSGEKRAVCAEPGTSGAETGNSGFKTQDGKAGVRKAEEKTGALTDAAGVLLRGRLPGVICPQGELTAAGILEIPLNSEEMWDRALHLELKVSLDGASNTYPLWVYPSVRPVCPDSVYEARWLDEKAKAVLEAGGKVYLSPPSDAASLPHSIQAQFTTDFWSVGTFSSQEGGMGQLIHEKHPLFREFPTSFHTDWQWWALASRRAVVLPGNLSRLLLTSSIITEMDSYAYMRPMTQLLECRAGKGKVLLSSFGLQDLKQYPETRALQAAIYHYMDSEEFSPEQEIGMEELESLVAAPLS